MPSLNFSSDDVSCETYVESAVKAIESAVSVPFFAFNYTGNGSSTSLTSQYGGANAASTIDLYRLAVLAVSTFGIAGNVLNLIVLTRRRLQRSMDGLERSVRLGLVALAVSDMMFCFLYLTTRLMPSIKVKYSPYDSLFSLYFQIYHEGLINVFQVTSTWLTVNVALGRYIAICHPLHARGYIRPRGTRIAVCAIIMASILFNIPRFNKYHIDRTPCSKLLVGYAGASAGRWRASSELISDAGTTSTMIGDVIASTAAAKSQQLEPPSDCSCYYYWKANGWLYNSEAIRLSYSFASLLVEILLPLLILTVCNICLIQALRRSYRMQSLYRTNQKPVDSAHRITPTLISLIVLFMVLVSPSYLSDCVSLVKELAGGAGGAASYPPLKLVNRVTNFTLLVNFSVNFVLYLVINVEFRRATRDLVTCRDGGGTDTEVGGSCRYQPTTSTTMTTTTTPSVAAGNCYKLVGHRPVGTGNGGTAVPLETEEKPGSLDDVLETEASV